MRTRVEPEANYRSVFINGATIRMPIDRTKPVTELRWPEFYDLSPGNKCVTGGNGRKDPSSACWYCYASAHAGGKHYANLVDKVDQFFGRMSLNQRPFQVAIGGQQEPLENPGLWDMIRRLKALQIVPNYTTNGVLVNDSVIEKTLENCGGVAVTLHKHLEPFWRKALTRLLAAKIRTNIHIIISDRESIDYLARLYQEYNGQIDYFVLLPYMNVGFASGPNARQIDYDYLERWADGAAHYSNIAFGSNMYSWLQRIRKYGVSLYPPESMSKYLIMNDEMKVYNNSFECREVAFSPESGVAVGA